jgi:hypothetical protein
MLSPSTVWRFSVAADINSKVIDFYFLMWSLTRLLCCVGSGFNVAAVLDYAIINILLIIEHNGNVSPENLTLICFGKSQNLCAGNMVHQVVAEERAKFPCSQLCPNTLKLTRQTSSPQLAAY